MGQRVLTVILLSLALGSYGAFAADDSTTAEQAQPDRNAAASADDAKCAGAVSLFYLGNPAAAPGRYNNPWIDCKAPGSSR